MFEPKFLEHLRYFSCNFVKSQEFDDNSQLQSVQVPLQSFSINKSKYQLTRFNPIWFKINALTDILQFNIVDINNQEISNDFDFVVTVNFQ